MRNRKLKRLFSVLMVILLMTTSLHLNANDVTDNEVQQTQDLETVEPSGESNPDDAPLSEGVLDDDPSGIPEDVLDDDLKDILDDDLKDILDDVPDDDLEDILDDVPDDDFEDILDDIPEDDSVDVVVDDSVDISDVDDGDANQDSPPAEDNEIDAGSNIIGEEDSINQHDPEEEDSGVQTFPSPQLFYPAPNSAKNLNRIDPFSNVLQPGETKFTKTAELVEGMVNTWDITVRLEAMDTDKTSDIVLVIDRSLSMRGNKLTAAKNAAKNFVDTLLADKQTNVQIALVDYGTDVDTLNSGTFYGPGQTSRDTLNAAIDGLSASGYTHTQAAIRQAQLLLAPSQADIKNIVLLSDGVPTRSYGLRNTNDDNNFNYIENLNQYHTKDDLSADSFNDTTVGSGGNMTTQIGGWGSRYYYHHGNSAIAESRFAKTAGSIIYTIALELDGDGAEVLEKISSPGKNYTADTTQLSAIFAEIAGSITGALNNGVVLDEMGVGFQIPADQVAKINVSQGDVSYNSEDRKIDWNLNGPLQYVDGSRNLRYAELKYRVEINDDILTAIPSEEGGKLYKTNNVTKVSYKDVNSNDVNALIDSPVVDPVLLNVSKVLKDADGNTIEDDREFNIQVVGPDYNHTYQVKGGETKVLTNLRYVNNNNHYTVTEIFSVDDSLSQEDYLINYAPETFIVGESSSVIDSDADKNVVVTNQEKALGKISVTKVFDNMPELPASIISLLSIFPMSATQLTFEFDLYRVTGSDEVKVNTEPLVLIAGETKTWENLPYGEYRVVETTTGYDTTYDPLDGNVTLTVNNKEATVTVTNQVMDSVSVSATKVWDGGPSPHPEIWFRLLRKTTETENVSVGVDIEVSEKLTHTWSNLPRYSPEGKPYEYSVVELVKIGVVDVIGPPSGYYSTIEKTDNGILITNKWIETEWTPIVKKVLTGRDLNNQEFEFELVQIDEEGNPIIGVSPLTAKNDEDGDVVFADINYTKEDAGNTYRYRITELESGLGGVTDSEKVVFVTVRVSYDEATGELTADVTYDSEDVTFTNSYLSEDGEGEIAGTKALSGRTLNNGEFSFELYEADYEGNIAEDAVALQTTTNAGNAFSFTLTYEDGEEGTYYYVVKEVVTDGLGGVTYDESKFLYTVVVTDDLEGHIEVAVTSPEDTEFNNTYTASGTWLPQVSKALAGRDLKAEEFTFELRAANGDLIQSVSNDEDGNVIFTAITYTQADIGKTYNYTIHEVVLEFEDGMAYDSHFVDVSVEISDAGNGALTVTPTYSGDVIFNNTYTASGSWTPVVYKTLTGRELKNGEFTFEFRDENGVLIESVTNDGEGKVSFASIQYDQTDIGESYSYTIYEVLGSENGMDYDKAIHVVTVTIEDAGNGRLIVWPDNQSVSFENTYTASGSWTPEVEKELTGRDLKAEEFEFELVQVDELDVPIPDVLSLKAKNDINGNVVFDAISYDENDIGKEYRYLIVELNDSLPGVSYDDSKVIYTAQVSDAGNGKLDISTSLEDDGIVVFRNTYTADPVDITLDGTKDLVGRPLLDGEFTFNLYESDEIGNILEGAKPISTTTNDGSNFSFDLTYKQGEAGTYFYVVTERAGSLGGVTYDDAKFVYEVVVTDNLEGKMVADVIEPEDSEFNNTYKPAPISFEFEGVKVLEGRPLLENDFEFELYATNEAFEIVGDVIEVVSNKANGSVNFSEIEFTEVGTYYFVIIEKSNGLGGVTYSEEVIEVVVTIEDDLEGYLYGSVEYVDDYQTFTNVYVPAPIRFDLVIEKELTGRDINDGEFEFELVNEANEVIATAENHGNDVFFELVFNTVGTYKYKVREVKGNLAHIVYDETVYEVVIEIYDNLEGSLEVRYTGDEVITFTNEYVTHPSIDVHKSARLLNGETHFTKVGDIIEYTVVATNTGDIELMNVEITDEKEGLYDINFYIEHVDGTKTQQVKNGEARLLPNEKLVMVSLYRVVEDDFKELIVHNIANAKGYEPDPNDPEKPLEPEIVPDEPSETEVPGKERPNLPDTGQTRINPLFSVMFISAGAYLILKKKRESDQ